MLGLPQEQVRVVTKYLGGGFGCKGSCWPHTRADGAGRQGRGSAGEAGADPPADVYSMGHREDQTQTLTLGATKEGKLTALIHEKTSTTSPWDNYAESNSQIINLLYACPNLRQRYQLARANVMTSTFMRAPGEAPGSFAIECSMDDLAYQLGMDPIADSAAATTPRKTRRNGKPWSSKA